MPHFQPSIEEFKKQFPAFAYSDNENHTATTSIDIDYLKDLINNKSIEVKNILVGNGYELPTAENGLSTFSIKQYIMFTVAEICTITYASNSDLINYIREKAKEYKNQFINDFGSIIVNDREYNNIELDGYVPKQ